MACGRKLLQPTKCLLNSMRAYRVTLTGATTDLGQSASMLLRSEPAITCLTVHDPSTRVNDVVHDLQHIPGQATVKGITAENELRQTLQETDIMIVAGGYSEFSDYKMKNSISDNIARVQLIADLVGRLSLPTPFVGIVAEPICALVPMAAEIMQRHGKYDRKKLFGITGVDAMRAQTMYAQMHGLNPTECRVPVICGHSSETAVPLLSQALPRRTTTSKAAHMFTQNFRSMAPNLLSDDYMPHLGAAYSVLDFTKAIMRSFEVKKSPTICAFVENNDFGTSYFGGTVSVTPDGAADMQRYYNLSQFECDLLQKSIKALRLELTQGKKLLHANYEITNV